MRNRGKADDLMKAFRESRKQIQHAPVDKPVDIVDKTGTTLELFTMTDLRSLTRSNKNARAG